MKFYVGGKPHVSGIKFLIDNLLNMTHEEICIMLVSYLHFLTKTIEENRAWTLKSKSIVFKKLPEDFTHSKKEFSDDDKWRDVRVESPVSPSPDIPGPVWCVTLRDTECTWQRDTRDTVIWCTLWQFEESDIRIWKPFRVLITTKLLQHILRHRLADIWVGEWNPLTWLSGYFDNLRL